MKRFGFALAGALLAAASVPAGAAVVETHRYGQWAAIEGTTPSGSRVCGVSTRGGGASPTYVGVKFFPDRGQLDVHIGKSSWSIPRGTSVPVEIVFRGSPGSWATETATGNGDMVTLSVSPQRAAEFLVEFSTASRGVIRFGGSEAPWTVDLSGSHAATRAMLDCIQRAHRGGSAAATQPFESGGSSHGNQPAPVAPQGSTAVGRERRT
jgi:hypothetical protein